MERTGEPATPAEAEEAARTARRLLALLEAALEEKDALERALEASGGEGLDARLRALAHELRGPLNAIIGFAEVIHGRLFGDDLARYVAYAGDIHASGLHLLELIDTALAPPTGTAEAQRIDAVAIAEAALRLQRLKAEKAGVALRAEVTARPLPVLAPPRALRQILLNLLDNALKFTPRGGQITLSARADGTRALLGVADTGIGIPAGEADRIFERDYRVRSDPRHLRAGGSGLGLAIARDLARRMGGDLAVESAPDQGARFTLSVPLAEPAAPNAPSEPATPPQT